MIRNNSKVVVNHFKTEALTDIYDVHFFNPLIYCRTFTASPLDHIGQL